MKLWLLKLAENHKARQYLDVTVGFVIRAQSEADARNLAYERDAYWDVWCDSNQTSCDELKVDGPQEVIMRDFHAA